MPVLTWRRLVSARFRANVSIPQHNVMIPLYYSIILSEKRFYISTFLAGISTHIQFSQPSTVGRNSGFSFFSQKVLVKKY